MQWQDIIISLAQICLFFALIPSLRSKDKPALSTSASTSFLLGVIAICLFTLELWFAGITAAMVSVAWAILAIQKIKLKKQ